MAKLDIECCPICCAPVKAIETCNSVRFEYDGPRWISVEERLPDKMKHVLVFKQRNGHALWAVAMWHIEIDWRDEDGWSESRNDGYFDVTHWMPLPEPPKEDCP